MKASQSRPTLAVVHARSRAATRGLLSIGAWRIPCALGRSGRSTAKREGDGATPVGRWPFTAVYYRSDRGPRPRTLLQIRALRPLDGWCDAPDDANYNRFIRHPYPRSAEHLWRQDDAIYDVIVIIGHNQRPRVRGAGSAIFLHVSRPDFAPTAGCLAVSARHLRRLLEILPRRALVWMPADMWQASCPLSRG